MKKEISVGFVGTGNIGSSAVKHIDGSLDIIYAKTGYKLIPEMVYDKRPESLEFLADLKNVRPRIAGSAEEVVDNPNIEILVEATGTLDFARDLIYKAFKNGKSVVTPGKKVVARCMKEITEEAIKYGQSIGFEASIMASVPIINTLRDTTDEVISYLAIANGTTNYILTKMYDGKEFELALKEAQKKGFAEPDPTEDIEGFDTAHKNVICTAVAYRTYVGCEPIESELYREGIGKISKQDIELALNEFGLKVKLLAKSKLRGDGKLEIGTYPLLIPADHELAAVKDNFNAIYIVFVNKDVHFYKGKGAGADPTKVPVVDDIIRIATEKRAGRAYVPPIDREIELVNPLEQVYPFYLRFDAFDKTGVLSKLSAVLADNNVGIASVKQTKRDYTGNNTTVPVVMLTHEAKTEDVLEAVKYINRRLKGNAINNETVVIRVGNGN